MGRLKRLLAKVKAAGRRTVALARRVASRHVLSRIQHEVVAVGGAIVFIGELALKMLPPGAVRTVLEGALPVVVTVVQRTRTVPVALVESGVAKIGESDPPTPAG